MKTAGSSGLVVPLAVIAAAVGTPLHAQTAPVTALAGAITQYTDYTKSTTQSILYQSDQVGSSVAAASFSWSGSCTTCVGYGVSGSGSAIISNGTLGATASLAVTGPTPGGNFTLGATSEAEYSDLLTITSGTGTGVLALQYTMDGSITQSGTGTSVSLLIGGLSVAPTGTLTSANGAGMTANTLGTFIGVGSHTDTLSVYIPFTYGSAFAIAPDLLADPEYFSSLGNTAPYSATVDFYNTLTLNSALVYGGTPSSLGALNGSADISSASGLGYGPNGLTPAPVPLPATAWLLLCGVGGLAVLARGRVGPAPA
jgi:hypothetical protein